jgi:ketosteroid isomerase-like protein
VSSEAETRRVVEALYAAFLAGDGEGMIAQMADDVEVTFLGQGTFHGIPAVRRFMQFSAALLKDVDFQIGALIIDGEVGSAVWRETATTAAGEPWENHGVDVIRVRDGKVASLHENNDVRLVAQHFPPYTYSEANGEC